MSQLRGYLLWSRECTIDHNRRPVTFTRLWNVADKTIWPNIEDIMDEGCTRTDFKFRTTAETLGTDAVNMGLQSILLPLNSSGTYARIQLMNFSWNQIHLKSQSHCLSGLYNLYCEGLPLSLDHRLKWGKLHILSKIKPRNFRKSHRGRSLSHDGQTRDKCCLYNEEQETHSLQVALTEYLLQIIIYLGIII